MAATKKNTAEGTVLDVPTPLTSKGTTKRETVAPIEIQTSPKTTTPEKTTPKRTMLPDTTQNTTEITLTTPNACENNPDPKRVCQNAIAQRAYEIYVERGCKEGNPVEDWLQAERELMECCK